MKIHVISFWYNEEFLAPFFLRHYAFVDRIHLIIDADTDDATWDIAARQHNVFFEKHQFFDGMNTQVKQDRLNQKYRESNADWVFLVDADEFINLRYLPYLEDTRANIFAVLFYQVYRNRKDKDLDLDKAPLPQRRYGDPNVTDGVNALYKKPIVARSGQELFWSPGCHVVNGRNRAVDNRLIKGAHWAMADPCFCIDRRLSRRARISEYNRKRGMSWHNASVTRKSLMAECNKHLDDPEVLKWT